MASLPPRALLALLLVACVAAGAADAGADATAWGGTAWGGPAARPCGKRCDYCVSGSLYYDRPGPGYEPCTAAAPCSTAELVVATGETACGSHGHDRIWTLSGTFLGGDGNDVVDGVLRGGNFIGGKGNDIGGDGDDGVGQLRGGLFQGGEGADDVSQQLGGTFDGGPGNDFMTILRDGEFIGGAGNDIALDMIGTGDDRVGTMRSGAFDGGLGSDCVEDYEGGTLVDADIC
ncbi:hypothetical protein M885DRAFT_578095 [Pelagophyceae sp. CCMP2097]|nr:hypothetical protein M885DRAFT_578095 [Pelagophyceae sp. CCMP2097]